MIHYQIPADGEYVLEIKDAIYRGREDFVYRIAIGGIAIRHEPVSAGRPRRRFDEDQPHGLEPPGEHAGDGRDPTKIPGIYPLGARTSDLAVNRLPFSVDALPDVLEREPNNSLKAAQPVTLPVIVNGRIQQPGDWDEFSFKGRAGDAIVAEELARRLESPLDSRPRSSTDAAGTPPHVE